MQLEQQETFEIKSPQLEVFGQVESKLPAPAKKRPFAAGFLAVMVLVLGLAWALASGIARKPAEKLLTGLMERPVSMEELRGQLA